jgi:hypothetical protein
MLGQERSRRRPMTAAAGFAGAVLVVALSLSCCGAQDPPTTHSASSSSSSSQSPAKTTETTAVQQPSFPGSGNEAVDGVFADLAVQLAPVPVYAPTSLPAGASLADTWWPVVQLEKPGDYDGQEIENPRIDAMDGRAVSAQVVIRIGNGWLLLLQNYRGDLGDVEGEMVGEVGGQNATAFAMDGGTLIQWSDGGSWYAVFGRNLSADQVIAVALSMTRRAENAAIAP